MSRRNLEAYFRAHGLSYIDVHEAANYMGLEPRPGSEHLRPFAFVVYPSEGDNLLVCTEARTEETAAMMADWAKLFGKGFRPVFARFRTHPEFWSLSGQPVPAPSSRAPARREPEPESDIDQSLPAEIADCPNQLMMF